ncbi:MAG: hypothetical protein ACRDDY_14685 [Clostridium sp.]|uniref:hypothetical protein n=1 Tax=Clostridium sp. TaxID=1506 RepID=UPI003EE6700B
MVREEFPSVVEVVFGAIARKRVSSEYLSKFGAKIDCPGDKVSLNIVLDDFITKFCNITEFS